MLDELEFGRKSGFPYNLLRYIEQHHAEIAAQFTGDLPRFSPLAAETRQQLLSYLQGAPGRRSLVQRIEEALKLLVEDRKSLRSRIDKLKRSIDKLENAPRDQNFDSDMRELTSERQALMALVNQINNKQTLNFLTDEGLLPNYAFPEAGITLRSVLWRRKEGGGSA